ncbi:MAG: T9SS type A sorting domain-containing protein [Flavobacteriales bacterium]
MKHITLLASLALTLPAAAQITDGSFEAGIGAGTWTEASTTFGTPLCDAACGTCGGPCAPNTGVFYAWYGGSGADTEIGSVEQNAVIPNGTLVELVMMFKIAGVGDGTAGNYVKAYIDGTEVGAVTAEDSSSYTDYTEWAIDITSFGNDAAHAVKIEGKENGTAAFNGLVDDVALRVDGTIIIGLFENESLPGFQIFPNPASDNLTVGFNALSGSTVISIVDLNGKTVSTQELGQVSQRSFTFDTTDLSNGVYMVSVNNAGHVYTQRVMVAH